LPQAILLNVIAVLAAKPLGHWLQAHVTTNATMDDVAISSFFTDYRRGMLRIRVNTRQPRKEGAPRRMAAATRARLQHCQRAKVARNAGLNDAGSPSR
jgi:hypothetical protein